MTLLEKQLEKLGLQHLHPEIKAPMPDVRAFPIAEWADSIDAGFCHYAALSGVIACPGVKLLPLEKSCYVPREKVFL